MKTFNATNYAEVIVIMNEMIERNKQRLLLLNRLKK